MNSGRDHYANIYATDISIQAQWLVYGAVEKANSVELLLKERLARPSTVMELGAGTGAIIGELRSRNFAQRYVAADYSPDACAYIRSTFKDIAVHQIDIVTDRLPEWAEVIILSHVLEHLEEPETLLKGVARNIDFEWFVIECPIEDLVASRLKNLFRDRLDNLAGHVQFFTPRSFRSMVSKYFDIVDERYYAPWAPQDVIQFVSDRNRVSRFRRCISSFTMGWGPRFFEPIWKRVWLGNCALLCRKKVIDA